MNRIPFNPYDFFGYLAAGLTFVVGMNVTLGFPPVLGADLNPVNGAFLLIAIYVAGQLIATPAKAVLEDGLVDKVLGRPNVNLFQEKKPFVRGLLFPGFYQPLPKQRRERILARAGSEGVNGTGEDLFLHIRFHQEIRNDEKLMVRLTGFLNNYGFARNMAFTSLVVGLGMWAKEIWWTPDVSMGNYATTAIIVGILLFYRYLKFFRQYSYELFNTYGGKD